MDRSRLASLTTACTAVLLLSLPSVASAHDPIIIEESQTTPDDGPLILDGTISFALYGVLNGGTDTRGFRVRLSDGQRLYVSLLIPDLAPENMLGPDELPTLQIDSPDGGTRTLTSDMRIAFDEPFSGTRYLRLLDLDEEAVAGEYAITISGSMPARFTVSVGTIEQFGTPVENVGDRTLGVAGVLSWYASAPPEAPATSISPEPSTTTTPSTSAPVTPDATGTPPLIAPAPTDTGADVDDDSSGSGGALAVVALLVAVIAVTSVVLTARRRQRR